MPRKKAGVDRLSDRIRKLEEKVKGLKRVRARSRQSATFAQKRRIGFALRRKANAVLDAVRKANPKLYREIQAIIEGKTGRRRKAR